MTRAPVTWTPVVEYRDIRYEHSGTGIAKVTINRPEVRNAFRPQTVRELIDAFARIRDDASVGCVLLTGEGDKAFCSGGDANYKSHGGGYLDTDGLARLNVLDLQRQIRSLPIPVIALVNGYAIGGGHVLHIVCDMSIASDNAIFGQVGPKVGSFDAGFGVGLLARLVGDKKAKEIWFLCRQYSAAEALEMHLVNRVVPLADLEAEGVQWANEILDMSPTAIRFLKSAFLVATDGLAGLQEFAGNATGLYYTTDEAHEGSTAFLEKRPADVPHVPAAALMADAPVTGSGPPPPARPSTFRIWVLAARPATLPAAVAGVAVGLGAALATGAGFRRDTAMGCVLVALLLQVVANFANDLSDYRRGADTPDRQGPVRVAAAGLVTERQLEVAIAITIGLAGVVGLWLAFIGGPVLIALGVLAVVAALAYTGGPFPYGYRALGEVFVFIFFGLVAVVGTAYLQAGRLEPLFFAAAVPPGALITAILVVNNLRDIPTDAAAGKRTLAVVLGKRATQREYALLLALAYLVPVGLVALWAATGASPNGGTSGLVPFVLLPLITLPMATSLLRAVRAFWEPRELNPVLKGTARLALVFSLLFALGLALAGASLGGLSG